MSKILNKKKIENHHWKKKYLQTYLPIFQKEKETFFFGEKRKKKKLSLQERQSKIEIYKKLTHATSNVTSCINI